MDEEEGLKRREKSGTNLLLLPIWKIPDSVSRKFHSENPQQTVNFGLDPFHLTADSKRNNRDGYNDFGVYLGTKFAARVIYTFFFGYLFMKKVRRKVKGVRFKKEKKERQMRERKRKGKRKAFTRRREIRLFQKPIPFKVHQVNFNALNIVAQWKVNQKKLCLGISSPNLLPEKRSYFEKISKVQWEAAKGKRIWWWLWTLMLPFFFSGVATPRNFGITNTYCHTFVPVTCLESKSHFSYGYTNSNFYIL